MLYAALLAALAPRIARRGPDPPRQSRHARRIHSPAARLHRTPLPRRGPYQDAVTNKRSEYFIHNATDTLGVTQTRASNESVKRCILRARMNGYESNGVDLHDPRVLGNPQLPLLTLPPPSPEASRPTPESFPKAVVKSWESGAPGRWMPR